MAYPQRDTAKDWPFLQIELYCSTISRMYIPDMFYSKINVQMNDFEMENYQDNAY